MSNILEGLQIFSCLNDEEKEKLSYFCQERMVKSGETIFEEGDEGNSMYILKTGECNVLKIINGKEVLIGKAIAEETLGEMALFHTENKRMASAVATMDSILIVILSFSIHEMTDKNPELLKRLQDIIAERIIKNKMIENSLKKNNF